MADWGRGVMMLTRRQAARAARREIEAALAANGWPWSRRISLWVDALLLLEESSP